MSIRTAYAGFAHRGCGFLFVNSPLDPGWRLARFTDVPTRAGVLVLYEASAYPGDGYEWLGDLDRAAIDHRFGPDPRSLGGRRVPPHGGLPEADVRLRRSKP